MWPTSRAPSANSPFLTTFELTINMHCVQIKHYYYQVLIWLITQLILVNAMSASTACCILSTVTAVPGAQVPSHPGVLLRLLQVATLELLQQLMLHHSTPSSPSLVQGMLQLLLQLPWEAKEQELFMLMHIVPAAIKAALPAIKSSHHSHKLQIHKVARDVASTTLTRGCKLPE